ncbi:MAG: DUF58 domain-containing protein [Gemmatimonadales bacterium]
MKGLDGLRAWMDAKRPILRFVPERRLAAAVALASPLWLLPGRAGLLAGGTSLGFIVLAAALDVALLPPRSALSVTREAPPGVGIGDRVEGTYVIASHAPRALQLALFDKLPSALRGGVGAAEVSLAPHSTFRLPFDVTGMARGRVPLGTVGGRARTRLGLVAARVLFPLADDILVIPSVSSVRRFRLLAMQHRLETVGVRTLHRKGEGRGFAGLREYVLGDDPRHIDWKATAHKRKLITREYTIERSQTVVTLIDAGRGMTQMAGTYSRFEQALSSALVLTDIAANAGDRVGTLVFDDQIRAFVPAMQSRGALQAVRNALIPVMATSSEPDYANAFRFLAAHQRKRALIVFFTDVIDVRASQALLAHASRSAARHLAVVVALRNDAIFAAALPRSSGSAALLYEAAAAEELILAREGALEQMRRAGVVVLDVSPRVMTASVINRYLSLKSRGAL